MTEHETFPGKVYAVTCRTGCTLTDDNGMNETVEAGKQFRFMAQTPVVYTSEPASVTCGNFKLAPAELLGLLGGGVSNGLPSGYLAAEFLESTGEQYIDTAWACRANLQIECDYSFPQVKHLSQTAYYLFGARGYGYAWMHGVMLPSVSDQRASFWNGYNQGGGGAFIVHDSSGDFGKIEDHEEYIKKRHTVNISKRGVKITGIYQLRQNFNYNYSSYTEPATLILFGAYLNGEKRKSYYRCHSYRQEDTTTGEKLSYIPAVDENGVPCMFDKVSEQPFYNSGTGSFIVGMTLAQARKLSKLPKSGGTLTVSLPSNYAEDEGVVNALAKAQENGWVITIQTYEAEAGAASTFALRRVWVRKTQDEHGSYVDTYGTRWQVEWCVDIVGSAPEQEGYESFRSVEAATEYWGLMPWVDPEQEEFLTNTEEV